jgi:hypothetical protein
MIINKVPETGNYIYIIKPTDTSLPEGKVLLKQPPLEMLQFGVEGHIELIPLFNKFFGRLCVAFCHEEGKLMGKLPNLLAQHYWETSVGKIITEDHLVGNIVVIVCEPSFLKEM